MWIPLMRVMGEFCIEYRLGSWTNNKVCASDLTRTIILCQMLKSDLLDRLQWAMTCT